MKIKEVSEKYNVPMTALRYYEKAGLFNQVKRVNGIREYDDSDIERLSLILTLKKAGVHIENILKYIQLDEQGQSTSIQKIRILKQERNNILDEIHQRQKNLDTLDCLIYKLKSFGKMSRK